jgi:DNA topoisomerase-1
MPGIRRVRRGKAFAYRDADGRWLNMKDEADAAHLQRIRSLAIPPAYEDVWICALDNGHLQATGRDARGRKQYRYHPLWRARREGDKFERMLAFGEVLPRLRRAVSQALAAPVGRRPGREVVLAAVIRLLDTTLVRVGNEEYARSNKSYGLTTLRNRHASVQGDRLLLRFRGKSGVQHEVMLEDPRVAAIVRRCQDMPGQELFQYTDEQGEVHNLGSADVNEHIRALCGQDFTAKDFRTWHATVHAWQCLAPCAMVDAVAIPDSASARQRTVNQALKEVAARLGNTVAVCRKSYVHPEVLVCALAGEWPPGPDQLPPKRGLSVQERGVLAFLKARTALAA